MGLGYQAYVLVSDVGLNGYIVHGIYKFMPPPEVINAAQLFAARTTGYAGTVVESIAVDEGIPCGGRCTRPPNGAWTDCYCYRNGPDSVDDARHAM